MITVRRENIFQGEEVPKDEGYGCQGRTTWRMRGYKYMPLTHGLSKYGAFRLNLNSLSNRRKWTRAPIVNQTVRSSSNSSLNPQKLKQLLSRSETRKSKRQLRLESKRQPKRTCDIMARALRTLNDALSINHSTIAQRYQVQIRRTIATSL